jgi:inosine-uridine nucleoside N-ribohydrolase
MTPRKIIIDTDPGIDDAMAIFYALASPELDVVGLTTVFGNAYVEACTENALNLLHIAGRPDIPVAQGAGRPLYGTFRGPADHVHGADGAANLFLPPAPNRPIDRHAVQFIIDTVMASPGEITLAPVGPLTNIALALLQEPRLAANLAGIVLMGGNAFCPGNTTPAAEANILNDPEAADIVLGADCPVVMAGLDVTEATFLTGEQIDAIATVDNPRARHASAILPLYRSFNQTEAGQDGIFVHDSTVISYLLAPQHYRSVDLPVRVDTGHGVGRGKTWPSKKRHRLGAWEGRRPVTILTEVDAPAVVALELDRLGLSL